jgi:hypothetical protein
MWIDGNIQNDAIKLDQDAFTLLYTHFDKGQDGELVLNAIRDFLQRWIEAGKHDFRLNGGLHLPKERAQQVLQEMGETP